ncbi:unnamed protein product, partial [Mesorhabditis spiculigera]
MKRQQQSVDVQKLATTAVDKFVKGGKSETIGQLKITIDFKEDMQVRVNSTVVGMETAVKLSGNCPNFTAQAAAMNNRRLAKEALVRYRNQQQLTAVREQLATAVHKVNQAAKKSRKLSASGSSSASSRRR